MALKSSNPYGAASGQSFAMPPDTITAELSKAGSKAKARYPSGHLTPTPGGEGAAANEGKMKRRAYTPGGPTGS